MKYYLSEVAIVQKKCNIIDYNTLFYHCFTKETSKDSNIVKFIKSRDLTKKVIKHIDKNENFHNEEGKGTSVRIQMYEFFFANTLLKAMKIPFMEDTFLISYFERSIRKRDTREGKNYHPKYDCRRVNEERRRERTMMLKKFYEFFSLLYDTKVCTPFSQFLDSGFIKDFKSKIKKQLNQPESPRQNSKKEQKKDLSVGVKSPVEILRNINPNSFIQDHEPQAKQTSRFGPSADDTDDAYNDNTYKIKNAKSRPKPMVDYCEEERLDAHDGTLSLSFLGNMNESNYKVHDSAYEKTCDRRNKTRNKAIRKRISQYRSDESDPTSSKLAGRSVNSRGSYKIEYLISKAFTPIVPTDNDMFDISKISWNNQNIFDNISRSGINESILMGRNATLQNNVFSHTDKSNSQRRSLILQSQKNHVDNMKSILSPSLRGNKVKQSLNYDKFQSNDMRSISSIGGTNFSKFPPFGVGLNHFSPVSRVSNGSNVGGEFHRRARSIHKNTVVSPTIKVVNNRGIKNRRTTSKDLVEKVRASIASPENNFGALSKRIDPIKDINTIEARLHMTNSSNGDRSIIVIMRCYPI